MISFWVLMSFWIGVMMGFGIFALMQMSRESADKADREMLPLVSAASRERRQHGAPSSRTKGYAGFTPRRDTYLAGRSL
ncbi:MAG: hypothetical protein ABI881_12675 [Betaproteobacteria bacterium]